jgi:hypothetical protein
MTRPLLVVLVLSAATAFVAFLVTRDRTWAPIIASFVVLFTLRETALAAVYLAIAIWWVVVTRMRRAGNRPPPPRRIPEFAARAGGYFAVAYLGVMAFNAVQAINVNPPVVHAPEHSAEGPGGPNIYLIMLDGYPRADTLRNDFGYDNTEFEENLARLGFDVSSEPRSNYNKTWLTYASMLNGEYIGDLLGDQPVPPDDASQIRWLHALMNKAALLDVARARGYEISGIPPPITTAAPSTVDRYEDGGMVTEFEAKLMWQSPFAPLLRGPLGDFLLGNQKRTAIHALETSAGIAEEHRSAPQLVLTQVESPHPPFALASPKSGESTLPACFPDSCSFWHATTDELGINMDTYGELLRQQMDALNSLTLDAVERIVAADPDAVVVLWSDHGLRYSLSNRDEHFRSFLAARTPGADGLLRDESPVNLLRVIFEQYLDTDTPALPFRAWFSDWDYTLRLTPWPSDTVVTEGNCSLTLNDFEGVPLHAPYEVPMVASELGGEAAAEVQYEADGWGATTVETTDPDGAGASTPMSSDFNEDVDKSTFDRPGTWQVRLSDPEGCEAAFTVDVAPPLR